MEQFDVLDQNGRPTGQILNKNQHATLSESQFYLGVHVYVHNAAGQYLLQRRALSKSFRPGCWDVVLGHCIAGETSRETALRELSEEMGLTVPPVTMRLIGRIPWPQEHHLIDVYFCAAEFNPADLALQAEEVMDAGAISAEGLIQAVEAMGYRPEAYRALVLGEVLRNAGALPQTPPGK